MPNPAPSLADTDAPDWMMPGQLAENASVQAPVTLPNLRTEDDSGFDPDAFLAAHAAPKEPDTASFDPDSFLQRANQQEAITAYQKAKPSFDLVNNANAQANEDFSILSNPENEASEQERVNNFDPDAFLQKKLPGEMPGIIGGIHSLGEATGQGLINGIGQATRFSGLLLDAFGTHPGSTVTGQITDDPFKSLQDLNAQGPDLPPMVPVSSAFNSTGTAIENYAKTFTPDPNRPMVNSVGQFVGGLAPVLATSLAGTAIGQPEAGLFLSSAEMGGMGGGQGYETAIANGATPEQAMAAGVADAGIMGGANLALGPVGGKLFGEAPALASKTWGELASNVAKDSAVASSKSFLDFSAQNLATGEVDNAVASDPNKQSQYQIVKSALAGALPGLLVGPLFKGVERAGSEMAVSKVANDAGQSKADFITNTAQAIDNINANPSMSALEKHAAVTGYLAQFDPAAQKVIVAHVANVGSTLRTINDAIAQSKQLSDTNPLTAPALLKSQTDAAIVKMVDNASTIEEDAAKAEADQKAAEEALGITPEAKVEVPAEVLQPEPPKEAVGAIPAEEATAIQAKLAASPDPEIQARAKALAEQRAQIIAEHGLTESGARKVELENELLANDQAMKALTQEPERTPEQVKAQTEPVKPVEKPEPIVSHYDEYGNPIYHPTEEAVNVQEKATAEPATATVPEVQPAEKKPVEPTVPSEQGSVETPEGAPAVAEPEVENVLRGTISKPVDLEGLKRPDLEKVALSEGHSPEDIKAVKRTQDLKDMIEAKRIADQPVTDRETGLVQRGKAMVDPKFDQLPAKHKKAVQAFIDAATKYGLKGVSKFVMRREADTSGREPSVFTDPRNGHFDTVYINPVELSHEVDGLSRQKYSKGDIEDWFQKVFSEEFIHNQGGALLQKLWTNAGQPGTFQDFYDKKFACIYDEMTAKQRQQMASGYGEGLLHFDISKNSYQHEGIDNAARMGEEFFRQVVQRRSGKGVTEESVARVRANKPLRSFISGIVNRFKGIVAKLESKGKNDSQLSVLVNDLEKLLAGKETAKGKQVVPSEEKIAAAPSLRGQTEENEQALDYDRKADSSPAGSLEAGARAGSPEAGASLLRRRLGSDPEKLGDYSTRSQQTSAYREVAQKAGKVLSPDFLEGSKPLGVGGEHEVFKRGNRVYKVTQNHEDFDYGTGIGLDYQTTPYQYLNRLALTNRIFGDDVKWEGVIPEDGHIRTVTSQPFYKGEPPSEKETDDKLSGMGFEAKTIPSEFYGQEPSKVWYRQEDGILLGDVKPANFVKTDDGVIRPIDVIVEKATNAQKEKYGLDKSKVTASPSILTPEEEDDYNTYFGGDEGAEETPSMVPKKSPEEAETLKPFVEPGQSTELKPTGNEKLRSQREVPSDRGQQKEQAIARQIEALKHVEIPSEDQAKIRSMAETLAQLQFSKQANRDIASDNAYIKAMIEAKKWYEKNGSLEGFWARRIIQNSLLDEGRKAKRSESALSLESPEKTEAPQVNDEGNAIPDQTPKGYDVSNQEYEGQQEQFEPVGNQGQEISHLETPAKRAQDAIVDRNIKEVTGSFSPYGKRLLELWSDTPHDSNAAFPPWASKAAKEFGITKAKVLEDFEAIKQRMANEMAARNLKPEDFTRISASPRIRNDDEELPGKFEPSTKGGGTYHAVNGKTYQVDEDGKFKDELGKEYGLDDNNVAQRLLSREDEQAENNRYSSISHPILKAGIKAAAEHYQAIKSESGGNIRNIPSSRIMEPVVKAGEAITPFVKGLNDDDLLMLAKSTFDLGNKAVKASRAKQEASVIKSMVQSVRNMADMWMEDGRPESISAAPSLRREAFAKRVNEDDRLKDNVRQMIGSREYEQTANKVANDYANSFISQHGVDGAYNQVMAKIRDGQPNEFDAAIAQNLVRRLDASSDGYDHVRAADLATATSVAATRSGKFTQALRIWSRLGPNGALAAYDRIIRPVLDKAQEPFKPILEQFGNLIKSGKGAAIQEAINILNKNGLLDKAEDMTEGRGKEFQRQMDQEDIPLWQRYQDVTAKALSKLTEKSPTLIKGAMEEFANRLKQNLKSLAEETLQNKKVVKKVPISAETKLGEIYSNEPEYKQAWDHAKKYIEDKYADNPKALDEWSETLSRSFEVPIKLHDVAILDELKSRGFSMRQIAKQYPDSSSFKNSVVGDIASRLKLSEDQFPRVKSELNDRFDELYKQAKVKNQEASDQADRVRQAKEESIKQGVPLWQRYTDKISSQVAKIVSSQPSKIRPAMEEFAKRVATNLKALANESKVDKAMDSKGLTPEQKLGEIYRNFPEYKQAWDAAQNEMRTKIGNDPVKLSEFNDALNKILDAPILLQDKVLNNALKSSGVSIKSLVREWAGNQNATREKLVKSIQDGMGLSPEMSEKLGNAISSRFNERLASAKKDELARLIKQSGNQRLANDAPKLADRILKAVNLGIPENEAAWNALADKLKLPKYDLEIANDLRNCASEIQKMIADGKEGFQTDNKTQDMMNVLADEAQKHMDILKQIGQGEMAVFYGNIFGPSTIARKSISEVLNLVSEVGTMAAVEMRHGDLLAIPRSYAAAMRGLYQRGGLDFRSIMMTGRGLRQGGEKNYSDNEGLAERGKIFGNVPVLSKLNTPLSVLYSRVGRALYGAQAFFYAGAQEARSNMIAYRLAKQDVKEGKVPEGTSISQRTQEILGNSPELRDAYQNQAAAEGLKGREAAMRAQELSEQQRPSEVNQAAHEFATRATFMQEPEGVLGILYKGMQFIQNKLPATRYVVPVTRVVSNVFNNFLSYTPVGLSGAARYAREGKSDEMYQQLAKMTLGGLSMALMSTLLGNNIQGAGPSNSEKRKQLLDEGWIPYSIKVGDKYFSYKEWPIALMMAGWGSYYDQAKYGEGDNKDMISRMALATMATGRFALSSSWISSVNNFLKVFDPQNHENLEKAAWSVLGNAFGSMIPFNQSSLKIIDKIFNPDSYPPESVTGTLMSQVAFVRQFDNGNKPGLNALGEPIETNPIQAFYSAAKIDPVWSALGKQGVFIPVPNKSEKVNGRTITDDEYWNLIHDAGQNTRSILESGGLDAMAAMDKEQAQTYLNTIYHKELTATKTQIEADAIDAGEGRKARKR